MCSRVEAHWGQWKHNWRWDQPAYLGSSSMCFWWFGLNDSVPRNSCVEAHKGDGIRSWCLQVTRGQSPMNEICVLLKDTAQRPLAPSFHHGRSQRNGQSATQRAFSRMRPCWCHNLGLPASKTGWNKCLLFIKPPSLCFFGHSSPNGLRHLAKGKEKEYYYE